MPFAVSGVQCPLWLPPVVAFLVALLTTPAGISGAFLLLPFQMSVLGFVSPAVTPTNLIYNVIAVPGGVFRFIREGRMDWRIAWAVVAGTVPGVILGAMVRVRYLPDPRYVRLVVAAVMLYLAARLLRRPVARAAEGRPGGQPFPAARLAAAAFIVGLVGGIYGVGGGALLAPFAMTSLRLPARAVAGPLLVGTFVTSLVGIASFELLGRTALAAGAVVRPDWALGLLFGGRRPGRQLLRRALAETPAGALDPALPGPPAGLPRHRLRRRLFPFRVFSTKIGFPRRSP